MQEYDNVEDALNAVFMLPGGDEAQQTMSVMADLSTRHDVIKGHNHHVVFRGTATGIFNYAFGLTRVMAAQKGIIIPASAIVFKS